MKIENLQSEKIGNKARVTAKVIWEDSDRPMQEIYFETSEAFRAGLSCNPHAFLVACILPAMHHGEKRLFIDAEICPALQNGLVEVMNWFQNWFEVDRGIVRIEARTKPGLSTPSQPRNAAIFLSGGIDSLSALRHNHLNFPIEHPWHITDGIIIYGQNIESDNRPETFDRALAALSEVGADAGITLLPVVTNIRQLEPDTHFFMKEFHGAILAATAHALAERISIASIAASESIPSTHKVLRRHDFEPWGSHPLIDPNYGSSDLLIRHVGVELSRLDKTRLVADWHTGLQNIKVCAPNWPGENCGRCEKCIRTMLALIALDSLDKTQAFSDNDLSDSLVRNVQIEKHSYVNSVEYDYLELIPFLIEKGRRDLARAIEHILAVSRQDPTLKEKVKEFDRKYLGGTLSKLKRLIFATTLTHTR